MLLITFLSFVALAATIALVDWRRGWMIAVFVGVISDPIRKLVPGTPVFLTMSIVAIYAAALFSSQASIIEVARDFSARYPRVREAVKLTMFALVIAFCRGLATFGIAIWKAPVLSLFTYLLPIPAILFGYAYLDRPERLERFLKFYSAIVCVALIGGILEFFRVPWRTLGTVAMNEDWIRHLPGIQVRIIAGFFRGPDIMAWHAGMLAIIGIFFIVRRGRSGSLLSAIMWTTLASWGFFNVMLSGRRKMFYMVAVFAIIFLWRQVGRLRSAQVAGLAVCALLFGGIFYQISTGDDETSAYAKASMTTRKELSQRLEGGLFESFRQYGLLGGGLGVATQGAHHLVGAADGAILGWQEGGAGKLAVELGIIGLIAVLVLGQAIGKTLLKIGLSRNIPLNTSVERNALFAIIVANGATFLASAQPYTDPTLALITAFLVGALFGFPRADEMQVTSGETAPIAVSLNRSTPAIATTL